MQKINKVKKSVNKIREISSFPSLPTGGDNKSFRFFANYWLGAVKRHEVMQEFFKDEKISWLPKVESAKNLTFTNHENSQIIKKLTQYGVVILPNFFDRKLSDNFAKLSMGMDDEFSHLTNNTRERKSVKILNEELSISCEFERRNTETHQHICGLNPPQSVKEGMDIVEHLAKQFYQKPIRLKQLQYVHTVGAGPEPDSMSTQIHIDRYLPSVKFFYSPFAIESKNAPFSYVPGSHYVGYPGFLDNVIDAVGDEKLALSSNKIPKHHLKSFGYKENDCVPLTCPPNSMIIACTNGLHGRSKFTSKIEQHRRLWFFAFYSQFNKFDLAKLYFK